MKLSGVQQIFAWNIGKLIMYIYEKGWACTLGEGYRTPEQALIYEAQGKGIKDSLHCVRLAIDINLFIGGMYMTQTESYAQLGEFWESLHPDNRWGGKFKRSDGNHFEMTYPKDM